MVMLIEVTPPHPMPGWLDGWLDDTPPPKGGGVSSSHPSIHPGGEGWGGALTNPTAPSPTHQPLPAYS